MSGLRSNRRRASGQPIPALYVIPHLAWASRATAAKTRTGSRTRGRCDKRGPTCLRHELPPALLESPRNGSLGVYAGPPIHLLHGTAQERRKKCNPLPTNDLRPRHRPNPRKKRNPCATTTYTQSTPAAALFFTETPKPAQKRKPLLPNTLRPYFRLLPRAKHTCKKSPRVSAAPPTSEHTIGVNTPPSTEPTPAANTAAAADRTAVNPTCSSRGSWSPSGRVSAPAPPGGLWGVAAKNIGSHSPSYTTWGTGRRRDPQHVVYVAC